MCQVGILGGLLLHCCFTGKAAPLAHQAHLTPFPSPPTRVPCAAPYGAIMSVKVRGHSCWLPGRGLCMLCTQAV
jgi:hypothetical protein